MDTFLSIKRDIITLHDSLTLNIVIQKKLDNELIYAWNKGNLKRVSYIIDSQKKFLKIELDAISYLKKSMSYLSELKLPEEVKRQIGLFTGWLNYFEIIVKGKHRFFDKNNNITLVVQNQLYLSELINNENFVYLTKFRKYILTDKVTSAIEHAILSKKYINNPEIINLRKEPFLILFHRANNKDFINKTLELQDQLPEYVRGRKIEYAFETDFFWIEHKEKISSFLGHAPHGLIPRTAKRLLAMKRGEGLLLPKSLFSRIGKIKLVVEVKSGWGTDTRALDQLVDLIKQYKLENSVSFYAFSLWVLEYLKKKLPNSFTILICWRGTGEGSIFQFPFNRPFTSLQKWGMFPNAKNLTFIDAFANPAKKGELALNAQISKSTKNKKLHFAGMVRSKEQLISLIELGARGAMIWAKPINIIEWLNSNF